LKLDCRIVRVFKEEVARLKLDAEFLGVVRRRRRL
jgi:hypothetical protein